MFIKSAHKSKWFGNNSSVLTINNIALTIIRIITRRYKRHTLLPCPQKIAKVRFSPEMAKTDLPLKSVSTSYPPPRLKSPRSSLPPQIAKSDLLLKS